MTSLVYCKEIHLKLRPSLVRIHKTIITLHETIGNFLNWKGLISDDSSLERLFFQEESYKKRYERIFFLKNTSDAVAKGLPQEDNNKFERRQNEYVPTNELPEDLSLQTDSGKPNIVFTYKSLAHFNELSHAVRKKTRKTLMNFYQDQSYPSLRTKKVAKLGKDVYRCYIDHYNRVHLEILEGDTPSVLVRAIGGHRLDGIGD